MPSTLDQALTELDALELGFVLGALLVGAGDEPSFAAGLPGASGERCAQALVAIAALPRAERVRVTGLLARAARTPWPAGIDSVHAEHVRAALEAESPALVCKLQSAWHDDVPVVIRATTARWMAAQTGPAEDSANLDEGDPALLTEVQRSVFAGLAEVPPPWGEAAPRRFSRQLTLMEPGALLKLVAGDGEGTSSEAWHQRAQELEARLAREEANGLGTHAQRLAVAQRLPAALGAALLKAARDARELSV